VVWLAVASGALAVVGVVASRAVAIRVARRPAPADPARAAWLSGLLALVPAWLVPFLALLAAADVGAVVHGPPRLAFLVVSATAILGVIASDALLARVAAPSGWSARACWLLGAAAFLPAWIVALALAGRLAP